MNTKVRNSNIELLRIIAMMFIVIWHISVHAQKGELDSHNYIIAFCTTGVNLFILISGYFGIKLTWQNLLTLISTVLFYSLITNACKWLITETPPSIDDMKELLVPIKESRWWFINCYFNLMLLSPIINIALNKATDRQFKYIVGVLLFISCISGFCFKNSINLNGYNTFHFITIYVLGNAIKKFHLPSRLSTKQFSCTYILSTLCIFALSFFASRISNYNNPLIVISALSLFFFFSKLDFKSKSVNYIATFMLPVYLLQDSSTGQIIYKYLYQSGLKMDFQGAEYSSLIILYIIILLGSAFILDNIRRFLLNQPISTICKSLNKKANIFNHL